MEDLIHLTNYTNLPLSSFQKRLWIVSRQDKGNPAYNIILTYHLEGEINIDIFKKSMDLLFDRQHTMFSVFKEIDGNPYIKIVPRVVSVDFLDFTSLSDQTSRDKILSFVGEDSRKCFDIEIGPLYRLFLLKQDNSNYFFHATIHHLIFDGWSRRVFVQEFSRIYSNLILNVYNKLEPLEFQSYDYANAESKKLFVETDKELIEFWKDNLKECQTELKLPIDFSRKSSATGFGCRESFEISKDLTFRLRELSKKQEASVFSTLLSFLGVLLQKYSGDTDICIGIPVSSRRTHPFLDKIFGLFISTTVVRLRVENNRKISEHIGYARDAVRNAILYSKLPFEKIVETVNPERISGINPLFQVSLSWLNNLTIPMELGNIIGKRAKISEGISPFDLTFYMWESGDIIEGEIEYNIDILKQETIRRLKENFLTLVQNMVENPDAKIYSVQIICDEEKEMLHSFNKTIADYPKDKTLIQLFEEQVLLFPEKKAVIFKKESLTYIQLNSKTNQLAYHLRERGVSRNTPVGILAEKSLDVVVAILGILKAGGVYVPIDPDYPKQRIDFILKDSGCRFLLTHEKYMQLPIENVVKISLNYAGSFHSNNDHVENVNTSSDLAYIMYTSGTTGNPKGSMINQRGIIRLVRNTNYIDIAAADRILMTSAIVFDAATFEIWGTLLNGGSLYIVEKEIILNAESLGEELIKNDISILWLTSALFTHIAETGSDIFCKLKYLLTGGDVLSAPHINKVRRANPDLKVINCYGPTENTTFSTTYLIEKDFDYNIPIGKPISNSTVYIFDKNMNYQPIGVLGELYVGGDGVSMGYITQDALNRKCFTDHPHIPGERLYRTGDYARWLSDGNIEFHGRIDNQLKIRGFRVELEEIESVISEIDGVIETVIKPLKVAEGDYRLIAFLNVTEAFQMDSKEIGRRIKAHLPSYMMPSSYKFMQGFPRTINGKIDRKALNYDFKDLNNVVSEEIKTLTPTERIIHKIWSESLKTEEISVIDNFFDIGGNSLMAISVFSKIQRAFNLELGLRTFFDNPRIKDIAESIDVTMNNKEVKQKSFKNKDEKTNIIKGEL